MLISLTTPHMDPIATLPTNIVNTKIHNITTKTENTTKSILPIKGFPPPVYILFLTTSKIKIPKPNIIKLKINKIQNDTLEYLLPLSIILDILSKSVSKDLTKLLKF